MSGAMGCGGIQTALMAYYRQMDRDKIQFDFLVHVEGRQHFEDEIERLGGRMYRVARKDQHLFTNVRQMRAILGSTPEVAIVHIHTCSASASLNTFLARLAGKRGRIIHAHSTSVESHSNLIHLLLRPLLAPNATDLFACSLDAGKWIFGEKLCARGSVKVLNNAIDAQQFRYDGPRRNAIRQELGIDSEFVVGHIGRFTDVKNHRFLIDVFWEVHKVNPNSMLMLVGDGPLRSDMESRVREIGLAEIVRFLGVRNDVADLLQAMDVFVFPSLYEGLGVVAIEAQAAGLRTFLSDAIPEEALITDLAEAIPLSMPASCWAQRILQFADSYDRRDTYEEIVGAGYDIVKNAKWLQDFYLSKVR